MFRRGEATPTEEAATALDAEALEAATRVVSLREIDDALDDWAATTRFVVLAEEERLWTTPRPTAGVTTRCDTENEAIILRVVCCCSRGVVVWRHRYKNGPSGTGTGTVLV